MTPSIRLGLVAALAAALSGCESGPVATAPSEDGTGSAVATLARVGGEGQTILAGRRSPEPFRVRALDAGGAPVTGAVVEFSLRNGAEAVLSQPRALTDDDGVAETWLLDPRSGSGTLEATAGEARTTFALVVERAPGRLAFAEGTGEPSLPSLPHPDSVVRVRVLDTEERPMEGVEVWFAGHTRLSAFRDSTDAEGWARTVIRVADSRAGEGRVFAFLLDFPELTVSTSRPVEAAAGRVVLVSVDGLRGDAVQRYAPPTLSRLAAEGASTSTARTVVPSLTTPAHLSMLSGVGPEAHGIFAEELTFTAEMASLDPVFRHAGRRGLPSRAFMANAGPLAEFEVALQCRLAFGLDSLTLVEARAPTIAEAATETLADAGVRLVFVHLPDPDVAGHAHGFESPEYREAVLRADSAVASLEEALGEDDLLVVTSDHGGGGAFGPHQHGSESDEDVQVPLILHGAGAGPASLEAATILDVAPTVLWAVGLRPPRQYEGRVLLEAFR